MILIDGGLVFCIRGDELIIGLNRPGKIFGLHLIITQIMPHISFFWVKLCSLFQESDCLVKPVQTAAGLGGIGKDVGGGAGCIEQRGQGGKAVFILFIFQTFIGLFKHLIFPGAHGFSTGKRGNR